MRKSFSSESFTASFLVLAGIVIILYLLFTFSQKIWDVTKKDQLFLEFQQEIEKIERENQTLKERLSFQNTPQFIDKYAKSNLGMVNQGEKVIVLPEVVEENDFDFQGLTQSEIDREILKRMPIREQWWYFFFDKKS